MNKKTEYIDGIEMNDGTLAWLTVTGKYYCRREPHVDNWTKIAYYTLEKDLIPLAKGKCKDCGEVIESQHCGDYVTCKCGKSNVDTDRWMPERHRYIGNIISIL